MLCITTTVFGSVLSVETEEQFIATWAKHSSNMLIEHMVFHVLDTTTGASQLNIQWNCFADFEESDNPFDVVRKVTLREVLAAFHNRSFEV